MIHNAIIVGASSGIGMATARIMLERGWRLGVAARRTEPLNRLADEYPGRVVVERIDVTAADAPERLAQLFDAVGDVDVFLLASGVGHQNPQLVPEVELSTVKVNCEGFTAMIGEAYRLMRARGKGRIAAISSIAGTKGLGSAPSYSASKRYQNTYLEALNQLSRMEGAGVRFTDIRPGFVRTSLLDDGHRYPMLMDPEKVARKIVRAIERGRAVVTLDWRYRILVSLWRCIPRPLWVRLRVRTS